MPTANPLPDLSIDLASLVRLGAEAPPACECSHSDDPAERCGEEAIARVTVVCVAEGCDCAAGVYLLCRECLSAWEDDARSEGVELRVTRL